MPHAAALLTLPGSSGRGEQWLGYVKRENAPDGQAVNWRLEDTDAEQLLDGEQRAAELRNMMLTAQAAIGGSVRWGKWNGARARGRRTRLGPVDGGRLAAEAVRPRLGLDRRH